MTSRRKKGSVGRSISLDQKINLKVVALFYFILALIFWHKIVLPGKMINATDQVTAGLIFRQFEVWAVKNLHLFPFWNPYIFGGIPFLGGQHAPLFYPFYLLRYIVPPYVVLNWSFIFHTFLAGLLMYLFLVKIRVKKGTALIVGISYMFTGVIVSLALSGHDGKVIVTSLVPGFFLAVFSGGAKNRLFWFLLGAFLLGMGILAPHLQLMYFTYWALFVAVLFITYNWWVVKKSPANALKFLGLSVLTLILSLFIGSVQYFPALDYIRNFSPRGVGGKGYDYAISWSLPTVDLISAFFAKFSGVLDSYWGPNPFKINSEYIGALPLPFALWAVLKNWKNSYVKFFAVLALLYILIALGGNTPFYRILYAVLPGIKSFRAPAMTFFVAAFALNVLFALGMDSTGDAHTKNFRKFVLTFSGLTLFIALLLLMSKGLLQGLVPPDKLDVFRSNYNQVPFSFFRTSILFGLTGYLVLRFISKRQRTLLPIMAISAIVALDLWSLHSKFIKTLPPPDRYYAADPVVRYLEKDKNIFRVLPLFYRIDEDYLMVHNIESVGGHHPFPAQSYLEFIGAKNTVMFRPTPQSIGNILKSRKIADLLNAKYIVSQKIPDDLSRYPPNVRANLLPIKGFLDNVGIEEVAVVGGKFSIYKNDSVLPRAFLVNSYKVIPYRDQMAYILSDEFDPRREVILSDSLENFEIDQNAIGTVEIMERTPNKIVIDCQATGNMILFYGDVYYSRWKARIEQNEVPILRANHTFRAIPIPKGKHRLIMYYEGKTALTSLLISLIALLIVLVGLILSYRHRN